MLASIKKIPELSEFLIAWKNIVEAYFLSKHIFENTHPLPLYPCTNRITVTSGGARNLKGGPHVPLPLLT